MEGIGEVQRGQSDRVGIALHVELEVTKELQDFCIEEVDAVRDLHAAGVKRLASLNREVVDLLAELLLRIDCASGENESPLAVQSIEDLPRS